MQTSLSDQAILFEALYWGAQGTGRLLEAYPNLTPQDCQAMLDLLKTNPTRTFLGPGFADDVPMAHKNGFGGGSSTDERMNVGIIWPPDGRPYLVGLYQWDKAGLDSLAAGVAATDRVFDDSVCLFHHATAAARLASQAILLMPAVALDTACADIARWSVIPAPASGAGLRGLCRIVPCTHARPCLQPKSMRIWGLTRPGACTPERPSPARKAAGLYILEHGSLGRPGRLDRAG